MVKGFLPALLLTFLYCFAFSQDQMRVVRTKSVDRSKPVDNIFVDEENKRWAANPDGVFQVFNIENGSLYSPASGNINILSYPDGNADLSLSQEALVGILGASAVVTTARYDEKKKELWLGTAESGVFQLGTEPALTLKGHMTTDNSKLLSNYIYSIFIDRSGKVWIGTRDGAVVGTPGKWEHFQRYFNIYAFAEHMDEVWVSTDELIWWVNARGKWTPLELDPAMYEGPIIDIEFDTKGNLWLASEIMTHFDISVDEFETYGPVEYFTSQFVNRIAVDQDDAVWIATEDKGLYQIEREDAINITIHLEQPLSCTDESQKAALRAEVVGGEPPYELAWGNDLTGAEVSGLGPGIYALTVTDAKGKKKESEYEIPNPFIELEVSVDEPADPDGQNGKATVVINGGVPEYQVKWDNGESGEQAANLSPGMHTVVVTDQAGCSAEATVEITQEFLPLSIYIEVIRENLCPGDENAVINYHANGGKKPYTSVWNNGINMEEAEGLAAGTYAVTLTDALGDTATATIDISEPEPIQALPEVLSPATANASDGEVALKLSGGTEPYSVAWQNGATGPTVKGLPAGEHAFTVTDANGCTATGSVVVTEDILPLAVEVVELAEPKCAESKDGRALLAVKGGKGPYQYQWNNSQLDGNTLEQIPAGSYSVTVTDITGTKAEIAFEIGAPEPLIVKIQREAPASEGGADGKAAAEVQGGTGKYTYQWDSGADGRRATNLMAGLHKVTVTDEAGCKNIASFEVSEEILPLQVELVVTGEIRCAGQPADGTVSALVEGGQEPYAYEWANGAGNGTQITGLKAGNYTLTVTDALNGMASAEVLVEAPAPIEVEIEQTSPASTNENDGKARARVTGGTGAYTYAWDTGESSRNASGLNGGLHTLTVTDENGCQATAEIEITEDILELAVDIEITREISCPGGDEGTLLANVRGGKGPYTYQWSADGPSGEQASGLDAGSYALTVTDVLGNTALATASLTSPEPIAVEIDLDASANTNQADGKATAKATGGNGKFDYAWDTGENGRTASALNAGMHTVTVTDGNGCTAVGQFEMTEDILPLAVTAEIIQEISCPGGAGGSVQAVAKGGKPPYSYRWNAGEAEGTQAKNLPAGTYRVTVTDVLGTTSEGEAKLSDPAPITLDVVVDASATTNESDGKASVRASGGTGKYTYAWENGESSTKVSNLGAGIHQVTVTDENGCSAVGQVEMTEDILPLAVSLDIQTEINCPGGSGGAIQAIARGGKPPYTYAWTAESVEGDRANNLSAGSYRVTVTDVLGTTTEGEVMLSDPAPITLDVVVDASATTNESDGKASVRASGGTGKYTYAWENGESSTKVSNLGAGIHQVTVTDENGCSAVGQVEMTEDILPLAVSLDIQTEINCPGGSGGAIQAIARGGKPPYTYAWTAESVEGDRANNLPAGTYRVTVTDVLGTTSEGEAKLSDPAPITLDVVVDASATTNESDGEASVRATGGTGKYAYQWSTGETSEKVSSLGAGFHQVTVSDENGCMAVGKVEMTEDILPLIADIEIVQEILCAGQSSGKLNAEIRGGKGPFEVVWTNEAGESVIPDGLGAGRYSLVVRDVLGTEANTEILFSEPDPLTATITVDAPAETNQANGQATVAATGGTGNYTYRWDNEENTTEARALGPGLHVVTVTDENGCSATASAEITENILPLSLQLEGTKTLNCSGEKDGRIEVIVTGGKSPYQYSWSTGDNTQALDGIGAGAYSVVVTDVAGNEVTAEMQVSQPEPLEASVEVIAPANTDEADGEAKAVISGGTGQMTYAWDHGQSGPEADQLAPGMHTLTVTDANGCVATSSFEITEDVKPLAAEIELVEPITCFDAANGSVRASVTGGKKPYHYSWEGFDTSTDMLTSLAASTLTMKVTDAIGQESTATYELEAPGQLVAIVASKKPCRTERSTDGKATLEVQGGTAPYTYIWSNGESAQTAVNLGFGLNSVTVTDANGCVTSTDVDIQKKILPDLTAGMLRSGQTIKIEKLQFEADSSAMMDSSIPVLNEIYEFLEDNPFIVVEIGGHTNGLPSHEFCDRLSTARAKTVADYIVAKGINPKRIVYKGYGKRQPIATNQTPDGRRRNQRVEVKILQIEEADGD